MNGRTGMRRTMTLALPSLALLVGLSPLHGEIIYGLVGTTGLVRFDSTLPGTITTIGMVSGLKNGETLLGIDFRPATGGLYALGSGSDLYTINTGTAVATQVGSSGAFTLSGTNFGFDFNPTVDRIRVVSNSGQNLRLNPNDGTLVATDGNLSPAGNIAGAAYTNNFLGAATTTLYDIDATAGTLLIQNPPNNGTLTVVGSLGAPVNGSDVGFDISGSTGTAYAALPGGLYTVNLNTGAATLAGTFSNGIVVRDISVQPVPEPGTVALVGLGVAAAIMGRKRLVSS